MNLLTCILTGNDCYKEKRTITPKGVMVHSTGANNPWVKRYVQPLPGTVDYDSLTAVLGVNKNGNSWNRSGTNACVHGFVGKLADGSVAAVQALPWNHRGWHAGTGTSGKSANNTHISFEICEDGLEDASYFAQVYQTAVELTAYLCKQYSLDPLADGVVICHSEGYGRGVASGHADVMHWFPKHGKSMDTFRADVAAQLNPKKEDDEDMTKEQFKALFDEVRKDLQDNDCSAWSKDAREWAVAKGLVQGDGSGNYAWEDMLTREQLVTILYRFANLGA